MSSHVEILSRVYDRLNLRDMEGVLVAMHHDVIWANRMEGGHVHGRDEVRRYWTRQWGWSNGALHLSSLVAARTGRLLSKFIRSCAT